MTLQECGLMETVCVTYIEECEMKRRLLDLGFVRGAEVTAILDSPSKGMRAYLIKGCKIGLRDAQSSAIHVEKGECHAV